MIFWVLNLFEQWGVHVPTVFLYTSTRMMLAAMTSLLFCICIGPYFIRKLYELKIGQTIRKEECPHLGKLHEKKQDTPTMGGVLILTGMLLSMILWMDFRSIFTYLLGFTTLVLGYAGGWDDYLKLKHKNTKGLSAKKKLLYQSFVALVVIIYLFSPAVNESITEWLGVAPPIIKVDQTSIPLSEFASRIYIPFIKDPLTVFQGALSIAVMLLIYCVIVGSSNAVNLTDGLDGLASGCLIMAALALALVAFVSNNGDIARYLHIPYIEGSGEIAVYLSAFVGACLGFLWYNGHPAQVFMGDIGSLTLGGVMGVSAVLLKKELFLGLIGGVFVAEALSVILQVSSYKFRNKRRIFLCAPLHHHFEYQGWAETKIVTRFWIIALLLAIIGIASLKFQ